MARGVNRVTRVTRGIGGGQGRRTMRAEQGSANMLQRMRQGKRNFDGPPTGGNAGGTAAQRGGSRTGNAGGTAARTGSSGGNAGGGSTSGDPYQNRGSRRAASATGPAPAVRPRPSEARAARGQLIRQIANRRQNARRSQRAA
jgi:hypothetical protein